MAVMILSFVIWVAFNVVELCRERSNESKFYKTIEKVVAISLLSLLLTLVPCMVHEYCHPKEHIYNVQIEENEVIVTGDDGSMSTFILYD